MGKALQLLFNLRPGEGRKASLFIILGLLWSVGSYGSFVLSEGMFLEHVGAAGLPKIYFVIACAMCILSAILIAAINRFSIRSLLFCIISLWIFTNLAFFLLYPSYHETPAFWYVYKAVGWIIPISTYIVYWAFVDQYYDLQDGKRFFCLFNSTTFLGDALGGGLIAYFLNLLGARCIICIFVAAMTASLPFIFIITKRHSPISEEHNESLDTPTIVDFKTILKTVFKSKFTLYLICFYFSMQLLAVVTEFNYMGSYEKAFAGAPENALTGFNGRVGMWISLGNMFFGMFAYSRLVKKLGINNIILVAPAFFLTVFAFWFFEDIIAIAIFGMIAREGMVYSFDDNNLNLLITGVPSKVKNQVRIAVESFIEPTGMFAAGVLLLLFSGSSRTLGLLISACALVIVLFLRTSYPRAIFRNLVASSIRFDKKVRDYIGQFTNKELKKTEFLLLGNLKVNGERGQLIAFEYLLKIGNPRVLPRLLNHVGKLTLPGKLRAIDMLSESRWATEPLVLERLNRWRSVFPHPAVKSAIHFYLAKHGALRPERVMHDLHSEHLGVRAAAILTLKTAPNGSQFPTFYSLASDKLKQLLDSKLEKDICIGLEILGLEKNPAHIESILIHLEHPSLHIAKTAARALRLAIHSDHTQHADQIITILSATRDSELRLCCLEALEKVATLRILRPLILAALHFRPIEHKYVERLALSLEDNLTPLLVDIVQDSKISDRCRLLAGKILAKVDRKGLQSRLFKIIKQEIDRAYFYFYHAHTIEQQSLQHDLTILSRALVTGYHSIVDFIIQLLGVAGSLEECEILSHTLRSPNRKIRAQAIESLEKTCHAKLFALLEPLIDESRFEEKLRLYVKNGGIPLTLTELLKVMAGSSSRADQTISEAMTAQVNTPQKTEAILQDEYA